MPKQKNVTAIDIGSSKIVTLIGQTSATSQRINIVGVSSVDSVGVRKGQIVNIEEAADAVIKSVEAAERMAGFPVSKVYVSVSGSHITSINSHGVVAVTQPQSEITNEDVRRVIEAARAISLPSSQEILHVIPRYFNVDSQEGVADPVGMSGVRLEVETHIITGSLTAAKNLSKCVAEIGAGIGGLIYSGLASAEATLTDTEKELGVILVDFGGGTTSIVIYIEGSPSYTAVLPFGAKNVTNDLAIGLRLSLQSAEKLKIYLGSNKQKYSNDSSKAFNLSTLDEPGEKPDEDEIDLAKLGIMEEDKKISRKTLVEGIIKPRLNEVFSLISDEVSKSGFAGMTPSGIVLTGGGSLVTGAVESCKRCLALPVRVGIPGNMSGLIDDVISPAYACAAGLLLFGLKQDQNDSGNGSFPDMGRITGKIPFKGSAQRLVGFIKSFLP